MTAVGIRNHDCVKLLLANGADVNAANKVGTKNGGGVDENVFGSQCIVL